MNVNAIEGVDAHKTDAESWSVLGVFHELRHRIGALSRVERSAERKQIADQSSVYLGCDRMGRPRVVLLLSSRINPRLIERGVTRAAEARAYLGDELAAPIVQPLTIGELMDRSYAVFRYQRPLTANRLLWKLRKRRISKSVLEWHLAGMARCVGTPRRSANATMISFATCLRRVADLGAMAAPIREAARVSLGRLESDVWHPRHVLDHNDLWTGNLLSRDASGLGGNFTLIDWPGANLDGYGMYDVVRFARSVGLPAGKGRALVKQCAAILGCHVCDTRGHFVAALGHLAANLEHFELRQFIKCSWGCWEFLDRLIREDSSRHEE